VNQERQEKKAEGGGVSRQKGGKFKTTKPSGAPWFALAGREKGEDGKKEVP